ncbi:hypothetical protein H0H92_001844 [Tricholoma furcatifolium]|nr:hypothetical protein H0H92_001844 [Tricholoma furcatifolium]
MDDDERPPQNPVDDNDEAQSEDEDVGLDWSKMFVFILYNALPQLTCLGRPGIARPVIPKRGEKDFEPKPGGGSGLQIHFLDTARSAMFETLRATRTISSKTVSYAVWYPKLARTHVTVAKGIHFSSMGHSAPRPTVDKDGAEKIYKRLELLPEETIYLVEKGSLFCWKASNLDLSQLQLDMAGAPMTVQQVYAEMIGQEDLTLERLQVYTYLKRLGYQVTRATPPTSYYPTPPPWPLQGLQIEETSPSTLRRLLSWIPRFIHSIFVKPFDWWHPLQISRWLHHDKNYASLFRSLRFIPSGHSIALRHPNPVKRSEAKNNSPYQIFYNLYKPSTPFKRSAPPLPDFQVVVINARTTPMPTLQELTDLFDVLPELPPPLPRIRQPPPSQKPSATPAKPSAPTSSTPASASVVKTPKPSILQSLFPWAFPAPKLPPSGPVRRPHPFMALKSGKKLIVIAVVDAGNISFFRFCQGEFSEWPMA